MKRAIFLDRDGVINPMCLNPDHGTVDSPANPDQFNILPGVTDTICRFREMGFAVVVISNQPGVAKGKMVPDLLNEITEKMKRLLYHSGAELDGIYYCLHHPDALLPEYRELCECRKPKPGLLLRAAEELEIDLKSSFMIGDGLTDVLAGQSVGCRTVWLGNLKCEICREMDKHRVRPDFVADNLPDSLKFIEPDEG
ncbi:MAG: HAD-IIIA family hydrolase [Nitrospinaceae bacterium]|jgi:D-glycero-D-manno-heptose 1,7-bisphosphate phosphatase|nr:HAD-IIIA family hydrolase [Nitrospinaceae bacterium]MBT5368213.1 HAD-IIIA family hydrolase [Nitrospinaceae bacterium]MBT6395761.1 HAD-IIIA family hydrolase [Nitrospinaceae bacterium]